MKTNNFKKNLFKFFLFQLSHRRHFFPILSIYFLSLPDVNAAQIGLYTGIGYLAGFLLEIPSSYFADNFGHKKTLILGKILMVLSVVSFIIADGLSLFIIGSILLSASIAFTSGTDSAFIHNMLVSMKKGKEFTKIMSKNSANVSFFSAILIILLPFASKWSLVLPLQINLVFDLIGLVAVSSLVNPPARKRVEKYESTFKTLKKSVNYKFLPIALFTGLIGGFLLGDSAFRSPYLVSLGYPIVFIGLVMGVSRFIWFGIGHYAHYIKEKVGIKRLLQIEMFLFPFLYLLIVIFRNPFVVGAVSSMSIGYFWGRRAIINDYILNKCLKNKNYKATVLSFSHQVQNIIEVVVAFLGGLLMNLSYQIGFAFLGLSLFVSLLILYPWIHKRIFVNLP
ncbi:MAG: MFS transporter [Nanoarchaeota archaeon]